MGARRWSSSRRSSSARPSGTCSRRSSRGLLRRSPEQASPPASEQAGPGEGREDDALPRVCSREGAPLEASERQGLPTGRRPGASSIHYILVSEGLSARVSARPCFAYVHFKE